MFKFFVVLVLACLSVVMAQDPAAAFGDISGADHMVPINAMVGGLVVLLGVTIQNLFQH